jgi:hypothetical protein
LFCFFTNQGIKQQFLVRILLLFQGNTNTVSYFP